MKNKILACTHRINSDFGVVGKALQKRGFELERNFVLARKDYDIENYSALVLFGGPQSATDNDDAIKKECQLVERALKKNIPTLGICLGAQIMTRVIGGEIFQHNNKQVEAGFYPITATEQGKDIFPEKLFVYHWHKEGMTLPPSAIVLAESRTFPVQAFQVEKDKSAFGLQFHPEIHAKMIMRWLKRDKKEENRLNKINARPAWQHLPAYALYRQQNKKWLDNFLNLWFNQI